jgi:hypothetical protein
MRVVTCCCVSPALGAVDQRLLLRPRPALHLPLGGDGVGDALEPLRVDETHGTPLHGIAAVRAGIVLGHAALQAMAGSAGIVAAVGALQDVEEVAVAHACAPFS